jgi:hypothetical protein
VQVDKKMNSFYLKKCIAATQNRFWLTSKNKIQSNQGYKIAVCRNMGFLENLTPYGFFETISLRRRSCNSLK